MKKYLVCIISALLLASLCPLNVFADNNISQIEDNGLRILKASPSLTVSISSAETEKGKTSKFTVKLTDAVGKVSISASDKSIVSVSTKYANSKLASDGTLYLWLDGEGIDGNASAEIIITGGSKSGSAAITVKTADAATLDPAPQKFETSKSVTVSNDGGEDGLVKKDGFWYYRQNGVFLTGLQKMNGYWRYFDPNTGKMLTGLQTMNGYWRYFEEGTGRMLTGLQKIDGYWYYFDPGNGRMLTGLQTMNGYQRYFDPNTGKMLTGLQKVNGYWYYFDANNGRMLMLSGLQKINGYWYYFNANNGRALTGLQKMNGYWRYFDPNTGKMLTGLQTMNGYWRYFEEGTGRMLTGLQKINGYWYYFDPDNGRMLMGWQKVNSYWRYFDNDTGKMYTGWHVIDGSKLYFDSKGICTNFDELKAESKMKAMAQYYPSKTQWLMMVDLTNNITGVYKGSKGNWSEVYSWPCTTGTVEEPTVLGEFEINSNRGYSFGSDHYTCYYYSSFYGPYLFHSGLYDVNTFNPQDVRMGIRASAGCVRLDINNAKWVLDNIPLGTKVVTYY